MVKGRIIQQRVENACVEMNSIIFTINEEYRKFNGEYRGILSESKQKERVGKSRVKRLITIYEAFIEVAEKHKIKVSTLKTIIGQLPVI